MDWEKAKRIVVVVLVILNCCLATFNHLRADTYKLTPERESAISEILLKNNIALSTDIVPFYKPMKMITAKIPTLNTDNLKKIFFDENDKVSVNMSKSVLLSGTKSLTINGNHVRFTKNNVNVSIGNFDEKAAAKYIDNSEICKELLEYDLYSVNQLADSFVFLYYAKFGDYNIFNTYTKITVSKNGISEIEHVYAENIYGNDEFLPIVAPDQALLTLLQNVTKNNLAGVTINSMDVGYVFQDIDNINDGGELKLVPCYLFRVNNEPVVVDAYQNIVL